VQLNVVDLATYETLRAPTALIGLGGEGHWLTGSRALATKRSSTPYLVQDGFYFVDFQ